MRIINLDITEILLTIFNYVLDVVAFLKTTYITVAQYSVSLFDIIICSTVLVGIINGILRPIFGEAGEEYSEISESEWENARGNDFDEFFE